MDEDEQYELNLRLYLLCKNEKKKNLSGELTMSDNKELLSYYKYILPTTAP